MGQNDTVEFGMNPAGTLALWTPTAGTVSHPYTHADGEWHLIAGVADSSGVTVYVDNEFTEGGSPGNRGTSDFGVNIGGCGVWDAAGNWFSGSIDEVAIFHSALGRNEIAQIFTAGIGSVAVEPGGKLAITWGQAKLSE